MFTINRDHLKKVMKIEEERFLELHPKSGELFKAAKEVMPGGVPMSIGTGHFSGGQITLEVLFGKILNGLIVE